MNDTTDDQAGSDAGHRARSSSPGWGAAPAAGPAPAADPAWTSAPADPYGPSVHGAGTPWPGAVAAGPARGPRPRWVLPVVAVAIGAGALLAGGGVGFAIGHVVGTHQTPAVQDGTQQLPGGGGVFPGGSQGTGS